MDRFVRSFNQLVSDNGFTDPFSLMHLLYGLMSNIATPPSCRIDRFLFCNEWPIILRIIVQAAVPRLVSDHCPILLYTENLALAYSLSSSRIYGLITHPFPEFI